MVFQRDIFDPAEEEEMIYIRDQKKAEDDEMQMLTPIMLESMFDLKSPPDLFRILKDTDKFGDDATVMTTESFSDILLPTLNTPPRITSLESYEDNDDASEISMDSYDRGEVSSPRNVISSRNVSSYPLQIPADVRYEGEVHFSVSSFSRTIHLQPRQSAQAESIFVPKSLHQEYHMYSDYALADSMSSFGESGGGAEECKDEESESSAEEGFAYVHAGDRCKEEDYWGIYDGHYGSRDYMEDGKDNVDYALDHASVQGSFDEPDVQSVPATPHHEAFNSRQADPVSMFEEIQDFFAMCFSCGEGLTHFSESAILSPTASVREAGSFGPADYGVAPRTPPRSYETYDPNHPPIFLSNYADFAAVHRPLVY